MKNVKNEWYVKVIKTLKLETTTPSGRINLAGVIVLAVFCLLYTTQDAFRHIVSSVEDTIKSVALKQDIHHPYQSTDVLGIVIPILVGLIICLIYLYVDDNKRQKLSENQNEEIEDPINKL